MAGDSFVIRQFYAQYFSGIVSFVLRNQGTVDDAKDLFQDAIMIVYQKAKAPDFELKYSLHTYFYGICKNLWLQKLKRQKDLRPLLVEEDIIQEDLSIIEVIEERNKQQLFFKKFSLLSEGCQEILKLFFAKKTMEEIAQKLGLGSAGYAKKRKYKCQKKLLELVKEDVLYKELNR